MEKQETFLRVKMILILMALTIATVVVFWQVQFHDFINFDDSMYVDNPMVWRGLSWESFKWAFQSTLSGNWHPLTWLSLMLDYQLYGKQPAGYHLINLFFHLANTLMLFLILKEITAAYWRSAFVAAMFAIHPLHVESVAWVAERKDVLSAFFLFLTLAVYVDYLKKKPATGKYFIVLFLYILGLMAKSMLVTLPFVLILLDFWPLGRISPADIEQRRLWPAIRPLLFEKVPFFVCSFASSFITYYAQSREGAVGSLQYIPFSVRISNAFISYADYIDKTLWPRDLAFFYPYSDTIFLSKALGAALIVIFISLFAIYSIKLIPYLFVGWFWYVGTLVPVIGIVQVGVQAMADRYTYIPLIGISLIFAWSVADATRRLPYRRVILSFCALLLLSQWMFTSWYQASYWKDSITLFSHAISVTPDNMVVRNCLGLSLEKAGRHDEAMQHFQAAISINPAYSYALNNIGCQLVRRGQRKDAMEYFRKALIRNPKLEAAHINMGVQILADSRTPESQTEAMRYFHEALRINPLSFNAHYRLGLLSLLQRDTQDAIDHFESAIHLNPEFGEAHYQLGVIYSKENISEKAILHYREALKSSTRSEFLCSNLAGQLLLRGKPEEALSLLEAALRINPNFAVAHFNMGKILAIQGRMEEARSHFREVLRIDPSDQKAREALRIVASKLSGKKTKGRD